MRLSNPEYVDFTRLHLALIHYVGQQEGLIEADVDYEEIMFWPVPEKMSLRDRLYEKPAYIDRFVKENPHDFSAEDLAAVAAFKDFRKGTYWIVKYLKKHAIFLSDDYAFGVLALHDPFPRLLGDDLPTMVEAVLLPFRGKIVYDSFLMVSRVYFGGGIRSSLQNSYNLAKAQYGIITELPIPKTVKSATFSAADRLTAYMKTAALRDQHYYDIEELLERHPDLENLYHQLWGAIHARAKKKYLKGIGIKGHHFAIHNDTILASAPTKKELDKRIQALLRPEDRAAVFVFKV